MEILILGRQAAILGLVHWGAYSSLDFAVVLFPVLHDHELRLLHPYLVDQERSWIGLHCFDSHSKRTSWLVDLQAEVVRTLLMGSVNNILVSFLSAVVPLPLTQCFNIRCSFLSPTFYFFNCITKGHSTTLIEPDL